MGGQGGSGRGTVGLFAACVRNRLLFPLCDPHFSAGSCGVTRHINVTRDV